jgi:tetratricopeptide (TPR) repeat protein
LDEATQEVAKALGEDAPQTPWPTHDVEAFLAYLRGRDMTAAHEAGVRVPDPKRSFDPYLEAARRDPLFADAQERLLAMALDFALGGQGPVEAAREGCERLLSIDPAAYKAHAALAEIDLAEGNPALAEERLRKVMSLRPDWTPGYERMGTALVRLDRYTDAIPWFEKALIDNPEDPEALQGLGVALAECGRLDEAVASWTHALRVGVDSAHLHYNLAKALSALGRTGEAREHKRIARRIEGKPRFGLDLIRDAWEWLSGGTGS